MHKQSLMVDAWMREAQEASKLVEDVETRVKNKNPHQEQQEENLRLMEIARSKLLEVGVKIDRLESLLRNPPSKPILTNEDLEYRWKMLSDIQLRTRVLALSLYAIPSPNRPGSLPTTCTVENTKTVNRDEPDQMKASISKDDPEMLRPLISDCEKGQVQKRQYSTSTPMSLLQNAFWTVSVLLGSAILLFILILICAVIYPRWPRSLFSPLKKVWSRLHSARKKGRGIYILYEDVKSCPYEDVQVLWSILVESHPSTATSKY